MKRTITATILATVILRTVAATPADSLAAGSTRADSVAAAPAFHASLPSLLGHLAVTGVPLVAGGLVVKGEDDHFRSLRNDYMPRFNRHLDDYLQYVPAAVMLGMKAFGVKGRSSWGRMLASDAFSAVLMAATVNTLKRTTHVTRPDGSNDHSFPSGHTATAFMTATMLTKEYGGLSPWVGIGAYTAATATGLMRMANNKHWLSDVLTGAGIGIISTELGYYLCDLVFKGRGLALTETPPVFSRTDRPSFVSLYIGFNIPLSGYDIDEGLEFATSSGCSGGIEGAYFFNPYFGIGGRVTASNTSIIVNDDEASDDTFDAVSAVAGGYASYPMSARWAAGTKLLAGYIRYPGIDLSGRHIEGRGGMAFGTGISLTFKAKDHYGIRFFLDYDLIPSHSRSSGEWMNTLALGSAFMVTF